MNKMKCNSIFTTTFPQKPIAFKCFKNFGILEFCTLLHYRGIIWGFTSFPPSSIDIINLSVYYMAWYILRFEYCIPLSNLTCLQLILTLYYFSSRGGITLWIYDDLTMRFLHSYAGSPIFSPSLVSDTRANFFYSIT